ncbi:MAG: AmmeMemoRadiSam system protein B [Deltaproteobacteria bacterium]|nr:AmmeMemoRadiSam system protein B [Deltaproteobacteria bacterium]
MIRKPTVAHQFYPGNPATLDRAVRSMVVEKRPKEDAIAIISPHAGYIYSGNVAGSIYSDVKLPDNIVLIGPNHTGLGERVALMDKGEWEMPFGRVKVNERLASIILEESDIFVADPVAHLREHSLEVQLPFIHIFNPEATIVPITVMHLNHPECEEAGQAIARAIKRYAEKVLIVVSSDMNHYESQEVTKRKDKKAIDKVLALDHKGLLRTVMDEDISMCGVIPATIALVASKELGAKEARLVSYATSGETSGDYQHVVGYAGILIK